MVTSAPASRVFSFKPYVVQAADQKIKALVYGPSGAGKTWLAASAQDHPALKDALFLNLESGLLTLSSRGDILAQDIPNIRWLEQMGTKFLRQDADVRQYKTVVIDSLTELPKMSLRDVVAAQKRANPNEIQISDYGQVQNEMTRVIRLFRDAPINFLATGLPRIRQADPDKAVVASTFPNFTPGLLEDVLGMFDFIWYLYQTERRHPTDPKAAPTVHRHLLTQPRGPIRAKTRGVAFSNRIGLVVNNPSFPTLYEALLQSQQAKEIRRAEELTAPTEDLPGELQPAVPTNTEKEAQEP